MEEDYFEFLKQEQKEYWIKEIFIVLLRTCQNALLEKVKESHAETYGKIAVEAVVRAGKFYEMRCPLDAEYKVGNSWAETH